LYGVSFSDAHHGTAVGVMGTILRTTDGGTNWAAQQSSVSGTFCALFSVSFTDADNGTFVGSDGIVQHTTDGGTTWTAQTSGTTKSLNAVSFRDVNNGIAVGSAGTFLITKDAGATWILKKLTENNLRDVSFTDINNCLIVGENAAVIRVTNDGADWYRYYSAVTTVESDDDLYGASYNTFVGAKGQIVCTTNEGTTWTAQRKGPAEKLRGVSFTSSNNGTAIGQHGTILHTANGGKSWISQTYNSPTTNGSINDHLKAVSFVDANNGFVVSGNPSNDGSLHYGSAYGLILHTINRGLNWNVQYNNYNAAFNGVDAINTNICIAVGVYKVSGVDYACYTKTTNGGADWDGVYWSNVTDPLTDVSFIDDNIGTIVGHNGRIVRTIDGTSNWTSQSSGTTKNLHGVCFTDASNGTAVGDDGTILRTTNGGADWYPQSSGTSEDLLGVSFSDVNNGTVVGREGTILCTTNGGAAWAKQIIITDEDLYAASFPNWNIGNAVGDIGTILRTTEGGAVPENDLQFTSLADMNDARYGAGYTFDGTYIYSICGGLGKPPHKSTKVERYDIVTNTWTIFATGLIPRRYCSAEYISSQDKIYVFNGDTYSNSTFTDTVEIIDVQTGEISYSAANPYPVKYGGSAVWNDKIYLFGGGKSIGFSNRLYEFDPASLVWTRLPDMPEAKQTNGEIIDGVLYVFGGYDGSTSKRIDAYNIQNSTWTSLGDMPVGISTHAAAKSGENIWLVGSYDDIKFLAVYETESNDFRQLNSDMTGRRHAGAAAAGNYLYIYGGNQASDLFTTLKSLEYADISDYTVAIENKNSQMISQVILSQNYPNPFNPATTINYQVAQSGLVELKIFNILGEEAVELVNDFKAAGHYSIKYNAGALPSGTYFYRLKAGKFSDVKKMLLLK